MRFVLIFLFSVTCVNLYSQVFTGHLYLALNASQVDGDTQWGYKKPGISVGLLVELNTKTKISLQSGLYFTTKGARETNDNLPVFKTHFNYVEIPLDLVYTPVDKLGIVVGLAGSYLISAKLSDVYGVISTDEYTLKNTNAEITGGLWYQVQQHYRVGFKYSYSLFSITNNANMRDWYHNCVKIEILYQF